MRTLRHIHAVHDDASAVAAGSPATWTAAVKGYLARRKRELMGGISDKASFDADKIRDRILMLPAVGLALGATVENVERADEAVLQKAEGADWADHVLQLAQLLTPPGWREHVLPALSKRREEAIEAWIAREDADRNLALSAELEHAIGFLQAIERDARKASGSRRVVGSPSAA